MIALGYYRHYKGAIYLVQNVVRHSETDEFLVIYQCCYGDYSWWARPLTMFTETVSIADQDIERFSYLGSDSSVLASAVAASGDNSPEL